MSIKEIKAMVACLAFAASVSACAQPIDASVSTKPVNTDYTYTTIGTITESVDDIYNRQTTAPTETSEETTLETEPETDIEAEIEIAVNNAFSAISSNNLDEIFSRVDMDICYYLTHGQKAGMATVASEYVNDCFISVPVISEQWEITNIERINESEYNNLVFLNTTYENAETEVYSETVGEETEISEETFEEKTTFETSEETITSNEDLPESEYIENEDSIEDSSSDGVSFSIVQTEFGITDVYSVTVKYTAQESFINEETEYESDEVLVSETTESDVSETETNVPETYSEILSDTEIPVEAIGEDDTETDTEQTILNEYEQTFYVFCFDSENPVSENWKLDIAFSEKE